MLKDVVVGGEWESRGKQMAAVTTDDWGVVVRRLIDRSIDWLIDLLIIDWLVDCLIGWLIDWLIDSAMG